MRSKLSLLFSLGLAVTACIGSATPGAVDGGSAGATRDASHDAGGSPTAGGGGVSGGGGDVDAGSGTTAHDAGPSDAGTAPVDAMSDDGDRHMDASTPALDAGTPDPHGGANGADAAVVDDPAQDAGPLTTVTFQEGVEGYHGTKSVGISDYAGLGAPGQWNANGATFADGENDWCTGVNIPYAPSYSEYWLIRFDDLNLPSGAQVVSASLTVNTFANDSDTQVFLSGRYLKVAWNGDTPQSCAGCSSALVGFRYRDGSSSPWAALGASGEGSDLIADKSFRIPESGFFPTGHNPFVLEGKLDPATVQSWLAGQNYGMRIVTGVTGIHVSVVQPVRDLNERPAATRPKLTITYALPQ
jgi:hypothetical protein